MAGLPLHRLPTFLMAVGKLGVVSVVNNKPNVVLRGV